MAKRTSTRRLAQGDANQTRAAGTPRRSAAAGRSTPAPVPGGAATGRRLAGGSALAAGDGVTAAIGRRQSPTNGEQAALSNGRQTYLRPR